MKLTLLLLASLWIVAALVGIWTPWSEQHMTHLLSGMGVAVATVALFWIAGWVMNRRNNLRSSVSVTPHDRVGAEICSAKPLVVLMLGLFAQTGWLIAGRAFETFVIAEGGYYLILWVIGYVLSRWCLSKEYVPVLAAIVLFIAGTGWQLIEFLCNPSAQSQFGPEIVIFAANEFVGGVTMLPLDVAVTWSGWLIGRVITPTRRAKGTDLFFCQIRGKESTK